MDNEEIDGDYLDKMLCLCSFRTEGKIFTSGEVFNMNKLWIHRMSRIIVPPYNNCQL